MGKMGSSLVTVTTVSMLAFYFKVTIEKIKFQERYMECPSRLDLERLLLSPSAGTVIHGLVLTTAQETRPRQAPCPCLTITHWRNATAVSVLWNGKLGPSSQRDSGRTGRGSGICGGQGSLPGSREPSKYKALTPSWGRNEGAESASFTERTRQVQTAAPAPSSARGRRGLSRLPRSLSVPPSCEWPHQGEVCIVATAFTREAGGLAGTGNQNRARSQRPDYSPLPRGLGSGHGQPQRPSASAVEAAAPPGRDPAAAAGLDARTPSPLRRGPLLRQKCTPARQPNPGRRRHPEKCSACNTTRGPLAARSAERGAPRSSSGVLRAGTNDGAQKRAHTCSSADRLAGQHPGASLPPDPKRSLLKGTVVLKDETANRPIFPLNTPASSRLPQAAH